MISTLTDHEDTNEALLLHEIARQFRIAFDRRMQHLGLTRSQWRVLCILKRHNGIRQAQMAKLLEIEAISLVRLLDRMEQAGWIKRCPDPNDRRANSIVVTPKVSSIMAEMSTIALSLRKEALRDFSDREHAHLLSYLERMKSNVGNMLCEEELCEA